MTAGTRRNGTSKIGPFYRTTPPRDSRGPRTHGNEPHGPRSYGPRSYGPGSYGPGSYGHEVRASGRGYPPLAPHPVWPAPDYSGRHAGVGLQDKPLSPQDPFLSVPGKHEEPLTEPVPALGKPGRSRAGKLVPAAVVAATVAAGATAFGLTASHPQQTASLDAPLSAPTAVGPTATAPAGQALTIAEGVATVPASALTPKPAGRHARPYTARHAATPAATQPAAPTPSATSSAPTATASPTQSVSQQTTGETAPTPVATPSATPTRTRTVTSSTLNCSSGGLLPENVTAIISFLLANGYSDNAAAGIAGNMYQESKGDPESEGMGGGGLIGWTPLPAGFVTGNVTADLQTQLAAVLTYNQGWSQYLGALNSASSPAAAADIYVTDFERAGIPAASTREQSADDVASACGI